MMGQRSGGVGILGLVGLVAAFVVLRKVLPSLANLFLILGGIALLGVVLLVAIVLVLAFRKPKKTTEQQIAENAAAILKTGRTQLMDIRRLSMKIRDNDIRKVSDSICAVIDKILHTLKERPDDMARVGRFFYYYIPTLQSILTKYTRLESCSLPDDDTAEKTLSCLKDMEAAMEKQYRNLFEDDKLDLSAEMAVMTQICKQDGLLADDYQLPPLSDAELRTDPSGNMTAAASADDTNPSEGNITLTL